MTVTKLAITSLWRTGSEFRGYFVRHFFLFQAAVVPYLVGGVLLLEGVERGMYWIAAAIVLSLFAASAEAWVLLVEINR